MKIPPFRRVTRKELGNVPSWVEVFLDPIQLQLERLSNQALPVKKTVKLTHNIPVNLKLTELASKPISARILMPPKGQTLTGFYCTVIDQETVQIKILLDGTPTGEHEVTI